MRASLWENAGEKDMQAVASAEKAISGSRDILFSADISQVECLLVHFAAVLRLDQLSFACWFLAEASNVGSERNFWSLRRG